MSESTDQAALFSLLATLEPRYPLLAFVFHVPNGEKRDKATAARLKTMGVRPGVPDLIAPFNNQAPIAGRPAGTFVGCTVEMKSEAGKLSPAQRVWLAHLSAHGWYTCVCYDWPTAARLLIAWAGGNPKEIEGL